MKNSTNDARPTETQNFQDETDEKIIEETHALAFHEDGGIGDGQPDDPLQGGMGMGNGHVPGIYSKNGASPALALAATSFRGDLNTHLDNLDPAEDLDNLLASVEGFDPIDHRTIIGQAKHLLASYYVHLPFKCALHGVDPIQRLNGLLNRLEDPTSSDHPTALEFHREMSSIFASVRDRHTMYLLPPPLRDKVALLGIKIEDCDLAGRRYVVAHVAQDLDNLKKLATADTDEIKKCFFDGSNSRKLVEVLSWNSVPIHRAVEINAENHGGANPEARRARGLARLTLRPLVASLPPDERQVTIGFRIWNRDEKGGWKPDEGQKEITLPWLVMDRPAELAAREPVRHLDRSLDTEGDEIRQLSTYLFAKDLAQQENPVGKQLRHVFKAKYVTREGTLESKKTDDTPFGYLRIFTFNTDPVDFVKEFLRLIKSMPEEGLIIDVRGNSGGSIWAAERILQFLTARTIEPERFQLRNTPEIRALCRSHSPSKVYPGLSFERWLGSLDQDTRTGAEYSRGFPITNEDTCNAIGQRYFGPVILITDALSYSAADIFAAGFQDHDIGDIIGVDRRTGGGGANIFEHKQLLRLADEPTPPVNNSPIQHLIGGISMNVAVRRALRVGERAGMPLESFGVEVTKKHQMTPDDLVNNNKDLIKLAVGKLEEKDNIRKLGVKTDWGEQAKAFEVNVTGSNINRLDVYVDGQPREPTTVSRSDGTISLAISCSPQSSVLELQGYEPYPPEEQKKHQESDPDGHDQDVYRFLPCARKERLVARCKVWIPPRPEEKSE